MREELVGDGLVFDVAMAISAIGAKSVIQVGGTADLSSGVAHSYSAVFWQQNRELRGEDAHAEVDKLQF